MIIVIINNYFIVVILKYCFVMSISFDDFFFFCKELVEVILNVFKNIEIIF